MQTNQLGFMEDGVEPRIFRPGIEALLVGLNLVSYTNTYGTVLE
ncbi:MAG: hypothetical protein PVF74_11365 [Anaerolineales bacterium]|jgi:hypothetical protein